MKKSNHTLRALIASLLTMTMFSAMFIGSTYAWFTDTATTGVNTIQSGTLQVALVDENDVNIEGSTLNFVNANGETDVLWEPGVTFNLDKVKVVNEGNLALKYNISFNGFTGDTELLEVIDFTVTLDGAEIDLANFEGHLLPGEDSGLLAISGHMQETAGNAYQDKTLTGAAITVNATQDTVEFDSIDNQYDKNSALTPVSTAAAFSAALADPNVESVVITEDIAAPGVNTMSGTTLNGNGNTITVSNTGSDCGINAKSGTIEDVTITGSGRGIGTGSSGTYGMDGDLNINNVTVDGPVYGINIGKGNGHNLNVTDSTICGWNSYAGLNSANFTNCTFGKGSTNYAVFAIYNTSTFTNCEFSDGYDFFGRSTTTGTLTLTNCTHDGVAVTAANFAELFDDPHDSDFDYLMNNMEIYVDGVRVNP